MNIHIFKPGFEILSPFKGLLERIELAGRTCYKSEHRITQDSANKFVRMLCKNGHESVLEHASVTVKIIGSRDMSHQLVRHRIGAFSQSSQRFVAYKNGIDFICPESIGVPSGIYYIGEYNQGGGTHYSFYQDAKTTQIWAPDNLLQYRWMQGRASDYSEYLSYLDHKIKPEDARSVLPNATKTEVVTTFNLRQWRHVFRERALNPTAQEQIRRIMLGILEVFKIELPAAFEDL
jgi:thymidylate synthase (FAD)